jgi:MFS family permease
MTIWSVFCGLTAAATGMASLLVIRVIFGAGEGPFSSTANKLVSNWFPRREQASAVGMANAGQPLGAALAGPAVGLVAISAGWRLSFVLIASIGFVWVLFWRVIATDRPEQHRLLRNFDPAAAMPEDASEGVVQKVGIPGYSKNRQSRASKGLPRFACYPVLNHAAQNP